MMDIDWEIEKALLEENNDITEKFQEMGIFSQVRSVFRGSTTFMSIGGLIAGTIMVGLFFFVAWKFVVIDDVNEKLHWGAAAWFLASAVFAIKLWFWIRMESNRLAREIKRVELQVLHQRNSETI